MKNRPSENLSQRRRKGLIFSDISEITTKNRILNYCLLISLAFTVLFCSTDVQETYFGQWRGENRDGKYADTLLLKEWPEDGPPMVWIYDSIGNGYGSAVATGAFVYVTGEIDSIGYLYVLDTTGKLLWKSAYGKEWMDDYPGSRCTPTVIDSLIYVCSAFGDIVCIHRVTGVKRWGLNMLEDAFGEINRFGYSQSLLVDDTLLFASPGGKENNVIAIDRFTGKLIWTCKAKEEISAYCSPILIPLKSRKIVVTFSEHELLGIDAHNGELLWNIRQDTVCDIHANTPIYEDGYIYYSAGCGNGSVKLKLAPDGSSVEEVWTSSAQWNYISGVIKIGHALISADEQYRHWTAISSETGELLDTLDLFKGVTIYADSLLYLYNERGLLSLVSFIDNKFIVVSSFHMSEGTKEHFAHPSIANKKLYIRHGRSLIVYDIAQKIHLQV